MSHFLWLFHVENVLHHDYKGGKAGKTRRHKKKKRIRKRALLIIWRLHVSQFKLAAGVFSTASKEIKIQFKNATKITEKKSGKLHKKKSYNKSGLILLWSLGGVAAKSWEMVEAKGLPLEISFRIYGASLGGGHVFSPPFNCHKYDL